MDASRRSLFGMLAVSPVVIPEMVKAFKEEPPAPVEKTHCTPRYSGYSCESYGGGFIVRHDLDTDDVIKRRRS